MPSDVSQLPKDADNPLTRRAFLCFNDWAGVRKVPVDVVGETPKRWRIQLPPRSETIRLAGRNRYLAYGQTALVPKSAVRFETDIDVALKDRDEGRSVK